MKMVKRLRVAFAAGVMGLGLTAAADEPARTEPVVEAKPMTMDEALATPLVISNERRDKLYTVDCAAMAAKAEAARNAAAAVSATVSDTAQAPTEVVQPIAPSVQDVCWTDGQMEAARVTELHAAMMTATLYCLHSDGKQIADSYNRYVRKHGEKLVANSNYLVTRFAVTYGEGRNALNAYDRMNVGFANVYADAPKQNDAFCEKMTHVVTAAANSETMNDLRALSVKVIPQAVKPAA